MRRSIGSNTAAFAVATRKALDVAGVVCVLGGETAGGLLLPSWTVGPFTVLLVIGVALLALRHAIWPAPSLPSLAFHRAQAQLRDPRTLLAWSLALGAAACVYVVGAFSVHTAAPGTVTYPFRISRNQIENLPARFDAGFYLGIARHGYDWSPELSRHRHSMAFFPAYPAAVRVAGDVLTIPAKAFRRPDWLGGGDARMLWGGVAISVLCLALALLRISRLATLDGLSGRAVTKTAVLILLYPFAFFFTAPYSESLFLLSCAGLLFEWRHGNARKATLWGLLAGLVRSNGWTVSIAMLLDLAWRRGLSERRRWVVAALSPVLGATAYSAYVWLRTGNPFEWALAQQGWGAAASPFEFLTRRYELVRVEGLSGYIIANTLDAVTFAAALLAAVAAAVYFWRRDWLYGGFVAAYVFPALVIDLPATGRMTAVLFPVAFLLARHVKGWAYVLLASAFACGQFWFARQFFLWRPPF